MAFPLLFAFCHPSLAPAEATAPPAVRTYDELLHAIRETRVASQSRITAAVEQEKVREAWETGKLIDEHILQHKERAEYGKQVIERLAADLGSSAVELHFMLQFARAYPIRWPASELSWSHYQSLLSLNDPKERDEVTREAVEKGWNRDQVREEVRRRQPKQIPQSENLEAKPGKVGTYRIVRATAGEFKGKLVLNLGFSNYYKPEKKLKFRDRDIVTLEKGKLKKTGAQEEALFTYQAYVLDIVDGDTLSAVISLGFGFSTAQKLRLRGLDAPEIVSAEGKEAKQFLEKILKKDTPILIKTVKSDKYDRYLADVWAGETYLNQTLLDKRLAVRVSD